MLCSLVTLTPYADWRRQHAGHHAIWNDLDQRMSGSDIYSTCLTVAEYRSLPRWKRLTYRVSRHPFVALGILPPLIFLFLYRVPFDTPPHHRRERRAVYLTNVAIALVICALGLTLGFESVLLIQLPILVIASMIRRDAVFGATSVRDRCLATPIGLESAERIARGRILSSPSRPSCGGSPATSAFIMCII